MTRCVVMRITIHSRSDSMISRFLEAFKFIASGDDIETVISGKCSRL